MKRAIDYREIRKGDLIRWEAGDNLPYPGYAAVEITADRDGKGLSNVGQHYLLDRPAPPVQLPEKPTLGWVAVKGGDIRLGCWYESGLAVVAQGVNGVETKRVESFTPAVAIPTEALDQLRGWNTGFFHSYPEDAIFDFLAAVDAAEVSA